VTVRSAFEVAADLLFPAPRHDPWDDEARPEQRPPEGEWVVWIYCAGRGAGKSRSAAEFVKNRALSRPGSRVALVARTYADGRDTMVEGHSGLLSILEDSDLRGGSRDTAWNRSLGELYLANGSRFKIYSSEKPAALRGPQHHDAWCLVPGTLVDTDTGPVPIEQIRTGAQVLTSKGYRPVDGSAVRMAQVWTVTLEDGRSISGSGDHPFATQRGWVQLSELRSTDRLRAWRDDGGSTPKAMSSATRLGGNYTSTESSTKTPSVPFRQGTTSTMSITTEPTIGSRTSNSSREALTGICIDKRHPASARSVAIPMSQGTSAASIARTVVGRQGKRLDGSSLGAAWCAIASFRPDMRFIAVSDVSTSGLVGPVHSLSVADVHEFFAEGVLTHNCDEAASLMDAHLGDADDTTWSNLMLGLRLGTDPRCVVSTTPKPVKLLRGTKERPGILNAPGTVVTRGSTYDNLANLAPTFRAQVLDRYEGTRLGRQELHAELLEDVEGALWSLDLIERHRVAPGYERGHGGGLVRVVVGVDPAATSGPDSDLTGIVVAGEGADGRGYVLDDRTLRGSPDEWGRAVASAYHDHQADSVVAEVNNGGEMVRHVIHTVEPHLPVQMVHASRGKRTRAEPVAAMYEQGKWSHIGALPELEDEMASWVAGSPDSPDRLDALVWAATELFPFVGQAEELGTRDMRLVGGRAR
jgi:predicted phage terminase large subunit-like protein